MAMCDGTTLNIDDVGWQSELLHDCKRYCGERLIDFDPLHVADAPAGARQCLFDGGDRPQGEKTPPDCGGALPPKPGPWGQAPPFPPNLAPPHPPPPRPIPTLGRCPRNP